MNELSEVTLEDSDFCDYSDNTITNQQILKLAEDFESDYIDDEDHILDDLDDMKYYFS